MRVSLLCAPWVLASAVAAFSDAHPWVLISTARFKDSSPHDQIQASSDASRHTEELLSSCPTDRYLVAVQPGGRTTDLDRSMPHLRRAIQDPRIQGRFDVAEVFGPVDYTQFAKDIQAKCALKSKSVTVDEILLASPDSQDRALALTKNDASLSRKIDEVAKEDSYTILFLSTRSEPAYESQFFESLQMNLKRDMRPMQWRRDENGTDRHSLPLFKKYQFFTPGIFMGLIVALILLSILGVGLKALSGLEVSYGAFEKDMGPAAHKKQQ